MTVVSNGDAERPADSPGQPREGQAPAVGRLSKALFGRFHWSGAFWYQLHSFGVRIVPEVLMRPATAAFALVFFGALGDARRGIAANLNVVLGPAGLLASWRRSYRTLLQHAWCMNESYEGHQSLGDRPAPETEGVEHWHEAVTGDRGFVMVTAHVGHWEVGSHLAESGRVKTVHVVREPEMNAAAQEFMEEMIERVSDDSYRVHFTRGKDPTLGALLLKALRKGEVVALQGDRPSAGGRSVTVDFFDRELEVPAGPAALARAAGVPLLPIFVFRTGRRRSTLCFRPLIEVSSDHPSRPATRTAMQAYVRDLEWAVRREPQQWFCLRGLWSEPRAMSALKN